MSVGTSDRTITSYLPCERGENWISTDCACRCHDDPNYWKGWTPCCHSLHGDLSHHHADECTRCKRQAPRAAACQAGNATTAPSIPVESAEAKETP